MAAGTFTDGAGNNNFAADQFNWSYDPTAPSGSGSEADPYQIATLDDLNWITQNSGQWDAYYIQTADIDASSTSSWDSGSGFTPIGNSTTKFTGSYDGGGFTISGLTINRPATHQIGLFGWTTNGATIQDLGLTNVSITGLDNVGALVGFNRYDNQSLVSNCYSTGTVSGEDYVGGLVGRIYKIDVTNSYSTCNVTGSEDYVGGLGGQIRDNSTVSNCYSTGTVIGGSAVGGLAGNIHLGSTTVSNCYSTGSVTGTGQVGGFAGSRTSSGIVSNCFWDTETSGQASSDGGTGKTTAEMKTVTTFTDAGWDFEFETENGTDSYWDMDLSGAINSGYSFLSWQNGDAVSIVPGCTDPCYANYYADAEIDIGSCENFTGCPENGDFSLNFDGDEDYVDLGSIDSSNVLSLANSNGSVSAWIYCTDVSGQDNY